MATAPVEKRLYTAEQLWELCGAGESYELVKGELREIPPGGEEHGGEAGSLAGYFGYYVLSNKLGRIFVAETGFLVERDPDTVRAPDMAFIAQARLPERLSPKWSEIIPDLVLEVVSPNDTWIEVDEKIALWLAAGVRTVWLVNPRARTVAVYDLSGDIRLLKATDTLDGGDIAPGFSLPVARIFT
jgi:Uma2 family endonuclease